MTRSSGSLVLTLLLSGATTPGFAATPPADPDDPALHATAVAALQRAKVLDIVFPAGSGLTGEVITLDEALADLDAQVLDTEIRVELPADVLFDFDGATLREDALRALDAMAVVLRGAEMVDARIEGHTDGFGTEEYNDRLSFERAKAVRDWLVTHVPLDPALLQPSGLGERHPKVSETTADGKDDPVARQVNRRVEVIIRGRIPGRAE